MSLFQYNKPTGVDRQLGHEDILAEVDQNADDIPDRHPDEDATEVAHQAVAVVEEQAQVAFAGRTLLHAVEKAALEAVAAKAYEEDLLSLEQVRSLLELPSQWEAVAVLKRHQVWPGQSVDEVLDDMAVVAGVHQG